MKNTELLRTQTNAGESQDNKNFLQRFTNIENSPFTAVKNEDKEEYLLVLGKYVMRKEPFTSIKEIIEYVERKDWSLMVTAFSAYNEIINELKANETSNIINGVDGDTDTTE